MHNYSLILLITFSSVSSLMAQDQIDTLESYNKFLKADSVFATSDYYSAIPIYQESLTGYINNGTWKKVVAGYNQICESYWRLYQLDSAFSYANKAVELSEKQLPGNHIQHSISLDNLGTCHSFVGEYEAALDYHQKALQIKKATLPDDHLELASSYTNIGIIYVYQGYFEASIEQFEKSLAIRLDQLGPNHVKTGVNYNNIGVSLNYLGEHNRSLAYFYSYLDILLETYGENHPETAMALSNIADGNRMLWNLEEAEENYLKSISILSAILGEEHVYLATTYSHLSLLYLQIKDFDKSQEFNRKSYSTLVGVYGPDHPQVAFSNRVLGEIYMGQGKYEEALEIQKSVLELRMDKFGKAHPSLGASHNSIAIIHRKMGDYEMSLEHLQKALVGNTRNFDDLDITKNPDYEEGMHPIELLTSIILKGRYLTEYHQEIDSVELIEQAISTYELGDQVIDFKKTNLRNDIDKMTYEEQPIVLYNDAINTHRLMFDKNNDINENKKAFYYAEKGKSYLLREALTEANSKKFLNLPDSIKDKETSLKAEIVSLQSTINGGDYSIEEQVDLEKQLLEIEVSLDSLVELIEKEFPKYFGLKYRNNILSVDEVQSNLAVDEALIEYTIADSTIYTFLLTKTDFSVFQVDHDSTKYKQFADLVNLIKSKEFRVGADVNKNYLRLAASVYLDLLAEPIASIGSEINTLTIIPDGILRYVPFEILINDHVSADQVSYRDLPYLIGDYNIRYGYSSTLLFDEFFRDNQPGHKKEFLAFAPEYDNHFLDTKKMVELSSFRDEIIPLKWNKDEVKNIGKHLSGTTKLGGNATESNFKSLASDFGIIHLAMHALVDDQNPMNSSLVFSTEEDSLNDGYLHIYEIYNMSLDADLAVLSACETGYGKLEDGEGIMSLARAFAYAGCPSIVMSHWKVDDRSTAKLIDLFYDNIANGQSKSESLRSAKLEFLQTGNEIEVNPYYWSSFVILGDNKPITFSTFNRYLFAIFGLLLVGIIAFSFLRFRKK